MCGHGLRIFEAPASRYVVLPVAEYMATEQAGGCIEDLFAPPPRAC
jgi:hypothetical protein